MATTNAGGRARSAASSVAVAHARRRASASIEAKQLGKLVEANFTEYPDCDIYGYCEKCSNSTCNAIMEAAHNGTVEGVSALSDYDHGWHAGQAALVLLALDTVCTSSYVVGRPL